MSGDSRTSNIGDAATENTANSTPPALEARGLTKRFGSVVAVEDLSFTVAYGAVTGFVGGNGSGKTTTMRMLLGLTIPSCGDPLIAGRRLADHPAPHRVVGAALDRLGAHPGMSARRHLILLSTAAGLPIERVDEVLALVGLDDAAYRRVRTYSTGMRQRLALAAALVADPQILVLDEPSNGLDPAGIRWLRDLLRARADRGTAVFVSTHHLADLANVADNLVVLDRGRLLAAGPVEGLLEGTGATSIEELLLSGAAS